MKLSNKNTLMTSTRWLLIPAAVLALTVPSYSAARIETEVTAQGIRSDDSNSSKFQEYKTVPEGVYLERISAETEAENSNYYLELEGKKLGLDDQSLAVEGGKRGLLKVGLQYDQTPHLFSTTGKTAFVHDGRGNMRISDQIQSSLQTSTNNAIAAFSDVPFTPLKLRRDTIAAQIAVTPIEKLKLKITGAQEDRNGTRPFGVAFGHSSIVEVPEPINYKTQTVGASTEWSSQNFTTAFAYEGSFFKNDINALTVDNPWRLASSGPSKSGSSTPEKGQVALPADNQAHNFNLAAGANLPFWSSRLNAAVSYGWMRQNDSFLDPTVNRVILDSAERLGANLYPPQSSLDGMIKTLSANSSLSLRPVKPLNVTGKVKYYKLQNDTPELTLPQYIPYDGSYSTAAPVGDYNPTRTRRTLSIAYTKLSAGTDVRYQILSALGLNLGYEWEKITREKREVHKTNEHIVSASLDVTPARWVSLRPKVLHSNRYYDTYSAHHVADETYPLGEGTGGLGNIDMLRKYDEANRLRDVGQMKLGLYPMDSLSVNADYTYRKDDYAGTQYGTTLDKSQAVDVELIYDLTDTFSLHGDYGYEMRMTSFKSRYREPGTVVKLPYDNESADWVGDSDDATDRFGGGINASLIKNKLNLETGYQFTRSKGTLTAYNVNPVITDITKGSSSSAGAQLSAATASNYPETKTEQHNVSAVLTWKIFDDLSAKLRYDYERYMVTDWAFDNIQVWQPAWNQSVFLDAGQPNYDAHIAALSLVYKFGS